MKRKRIWLLYGLLFIIGCQTAVSSPPTPFPLADEQTAVTPQSTPLLLPTTTQAPDQWQVVHPGIEQRTVEWRQDDGQLQERLKIIRIDPELNRFEVAYTPNDPKSIQTWLTDLDAALVVNGSFFTPEFVATGLTIIEGQSSGQSYGAFAGMVRITNGRLAIQDLAERPYSPNDPIEFAIQTFPMLVKSGGQLGYIEPGEPARRTVIGVDDNGRVLLIITQFGTFSLAEMSQWLVDSDLTLDMALNLDGGTSSSFAISGGDASGLLPIPNVIAIYPK